MFGKLLKMKQLHFQKVNTGQMLPVKVARQLQLTNNLETKSTKKKQLKA